MAKHQLIVYKTLGSIPSTELMELFHSLRSLTSHHLTNKQTNSKEKENTRSNRLYPSVPQPG